MKHSLWAGQETINHFMRSTHGWWQNLKQHKGSSTPKKCQNTFFVFPPSVRQTLDKEKCALKTQGGTFWRVLSVSGKISGALSILPISRQRQKPFKGFDFLRGKTDKGWTRKWDEAQLEICVVAPSPLTSFKLNYYPYFVYGWKKKWRIR